MTLAANGADIASDDFNRAELGKKWHINNGEWKIVDGSLHIKELQADKHAASGRWLVPETRFLAPVFDQRNICRGVNGDEGFAHGGMVA